jgi:VanZ family protein
MKRFLHCLPALIWAALIFGLSSMTHPPSPGPQFPLKDKVGHWMLYCVFGWLISRALRGLYKLSLPKTFVLAILIGSAYGVTDEFHQRFVPNRTCDVMDWLADTLGASAAAAAFYAYESHRSAKANRQPA